MLDGTLWGFIYPSLDLGWQCFAWCLGSLCVFTVSWYVFQWECTRFLVPLWFRKDLPEFPNVKKCRMEQTKPWIDGNINKNHGLQLLTINASSSKHQTLLKYNHGITKHWSETSIDLPKKVQFTTHQNGNVWSGAALKTNAKINNPNSCSTVWGTKNQ